MSSVSPHRIDPPRNAAPTPGGPHLHGHRRQELPPREPADHDGRQSTSHRLDGPHVPLPDAGPAETAGEELQPHGWLDLHAAELIDRLQQWADDLDSREAQLNARSARQDLRERQFRMHQHDVSTAMAEQQREDERLRGLLEAQARRLAFQDPSGFPDPATG